MKKIILALALLFTLSTVFTSCREENKAEEAVEEVGDAVEDAADEVEDELQEKVPVNEV